MKNAIIFILFILLVLILVFICYSGALHSGHRRRYKSNKYGGTTMHTEIINATAMQDRSRGNSIEFHKRRAEMRYTISGEGNGLDYSQLRELLSEQIKYGIKFVERPITEHVHISFGSFGNIRDKYNNLLSFDPLFFKQKSSIKNVLDAHTSFIKKTELYKTIKRLIPLGAKYIPATYSITEFESTIYGIAKPNSAGVKGGINSNSAGVKGGANPLDINSNSAGVKGGANPLDINSNSVGVKGCANTLYIIKRDYFVKQKSVKIISNKDEYYKAKKELSLNNENGIISEYITNPMTVEGRKFHLRVYVLLSVISGITRCSAHKEYKVRTAKEKYKNGDWLNPDIHLTGGTNTEKIYHWPDCVDWKDDHSKHTTIKNLYDCIDILCMALSMSNVKNYIESDAGYHLYGVDILITNDNNSHILEINHRPGFTVSEDNDYGLEYNKHFSKNLFSFILNNTSFLYFGICRPEITKSEFIGNGALSPFGGIITGSNKCFLIPINFATDLEIEQAKQIYFHNKNLLFDNIIGDADPINIFVIKILEGIVIGYILITHNNELKVAIKEEYQNRGIATAMVAQLLEIYSARQHKEIYIKKNNHFLNAIAIKLHFIEKNNKYERKCKHNIDHKITQIIKNKVLTYKIIANIGAQAIDLKLGANMVESHSQFVHFVFNVLNTNSFLKLKSSTGSKYNHNFIYQGAELKSTLISKLLYNIQAFKNWYYDNINSDTPIFEKRITSIDLKNNQLYSIYNKAENTYKITEINNTISNNNIISEYYPPFLLDEKLMCLKFRILYYISGNKIIKCFLFDKILVLLAENKYTISDINNLNVSRPNYNSKNKKYVWPNDFKNGDLGYIANNKEVLINYIKEFLSILVKSDIRTYSESNSGFLTITIMIKFIKQNNKWIPILHECVNMATIEKNTDMDAQYINDYYMWIRNCVINPHFGLHSTYIKPLIVAHTINDIIDPNIISKLLLYWDSQNNHSLVHILYNGDKIGQIYLNLTDISESIVKLENLKLFNTNEEIKLNSEGIKLNSIFILMEIIAAYYAPISMSLIFEDRHKFDPNFEIMHSIAYKLQFYKWSNLTELNTSHPHNSKNKQQPKKEYFIRKCR